MRRLDSKAIVLGALVALPTRLMLGILLAPSPSHPTVPFTGMTAAVSAGAAAFLAFALGGLLAGFLAVHNGGLNGLTSSLIGVLLAYVVGLALAIFLLATTPPSSVAEGTSVPLVRGEVASGFSAADMSRLMVLSMASKLLPFLGGYVGGILGGRFRSRTLS